MNFEPTDTTTSYDELPLLSPLPHNVWNDLIKTNHGNTTQMMSITDPITHHLNSSGQTLVTSNYETNLARMKEDLAKMFKCKFGLDMGRTRLY